MRVQNFIAELALLAIITLMGVLGWFYKEQIPKDLTDMYSNRP